MNRTAQVSLAAVLIVGAGIVGFLAYRSSSDRAEPAAAAVEGVPEDAVALSPAPATGGGLPGQLPEFSLHDREGKLRSIREWDGKSLVINFWATWCAPCRREIPMLTALNKERARENIEVLGIAVDFRDQVVAYADKIGLDYALLIGEQDGLDTMAKFGLASAGFPFTVFTDNKGRVVTGHIGELHAAEAKVILDAVTRINTGRLDMDQARAEISAGLDKLAPADKG